MKLVTFLTYFIKNQRLLLLKRQSEQQNNDLPSMIDNKTVNIPLNNHLHDSTHNIKMPVGHQENQQIQQKLQKSSNSQAKKGFFSKRTRQQRKDQPMHIAPIVKQMPKKKVQSNNLSKLLKVAQLPMQLFSIHKQYCDQFTHYNYEHLFIKLSFTIHHQEQIIKYMRKKSIKTNSQKNEPKVSRKLDENSQKFLSKEQMINHQEWKSLIQQIIRKLTKISHISMFNLYIPTFLAIQKGFNFIPAQIYEYVLSRNVKAGFHQLSSVHISNIMSFLKYKSRIKQTSQYQQNVKDQLIQESSVSINTFIQNLAKEIITNPSKYTKQDFLNIFIVANRRNKRMNFFTIDLLNKSQSLMLRYLNDFSFENVSTYMKMYSFFHPYPNIKLLQTLKIDLQIKCQNEENTYSLLMMLHQIKNRKLIFKNTQVVGVNSQTVQLNAGKLFLKIAEILSKRINQLKSTQINQFLERCFHNYLENTTVLSIISDNLSKNCKLFSLEIIAKGLFQLHLLGCSTKNLAYCALREFGERYIKQMELLKYEDCFTAPTQNIIDRQASLNFKQIHLQQCLIILIWVLSQKYAYNLDKLLNFQSLLTLYPSKVQSMDPLIIELILNINHKFDKKYPQIPQISCTFVPNTLQSGKSSEFNRPNQLKSEIQLLMWEQSHLTDKFIANYNFESKKFLAERWSQISTYKEEEYIHFSLENSSNQNQKSCFFDESTKLPSEFLEKRSRIINKYYGNYHHLQKLTSTNNFGEKLLDKIL